MLSDVVLRCPSIFSLSISLERWSVQILIFTQSELDVRRKWPQRQCPADVNYKIWTQQQVGLLSCDLFYIFEFNLMCFERGRWKRSSTTWRSSTEGGNDQTFGPLAAGLSDVFGLNWIEAAHISSGSVCCLCRYSETEMNLNLNINQFLGYR